ncbi:GAF and ANTAR domain-containing protein [Diaminobutyricibacter tongyongensis]|uniref:GAF and ANTAR domain-containing protein n=1 Tax=Leifsonia tongyongensis TaxID=1268043 RepID=A0A6L9XVW4_9MICO|nr:GAF and ANTAR domain-containing protein [Diaminobutyricibacter tongyongensis]NEN05148.1 GAF and ANTAR domain-containing protein [Diaminobutyricibacter tongyongensis]
MADGFDAAARELSSAFVARRSYCAPFLSVIPVTGAAISTIGSLVAPETLCATDAAAARLDEVQFDLGEGPCWEALATGRPVLERDIRTSARGAWPAFTEAIRDLPVCGMFAFPLTIGRMNVGVIDLYSEEPTELHDGHQRDAEALADIAARQILRELVMRSGDDEAEEPGGEFSRRVVHQATGMVLAQLNVTPDDALMILRAHAFASGRSVRAVADDVVARRLDFATGLGEAGTGR